MRLLSKRDEEAVVKMNEHGETTVTVEGIVVRSKPHYSTNKEGIDRNWEQILDAASNLDRWILWADIDESFAMTPESLRRVISWTKKLKQLGCIGMVASVSNSIINYYAKKVEAEIQVPFKASSSADEIQAFIKVLSQN